MYFKEWSKINIDCNKDSYEAAIVKLPPSVFL